MRSATKVWIGPPIGCLALCVEGVESQAASGGAASVEKCDISLRQSLNSGIFKGQTDDAYALNFNLRQHFSDRSVTLGKDMCWGGGLIHSGEHLSIIANIKRHSSSTAEVPHCHFLTSSIFTTMDRLSAAIDRGRHQCPAAWDSGCSGFIHRTHWHQRDLMRALTFVPLL